MKINPDPQWIIAGIDFNARNLWWLRAIIITIIIFIIYKIYAYFYIRPKKEEPKEIIKETNEAH